MKAPRKPKRPKPPPNRPAKALASPLFRQRAIPPAKGRKAPYKRQEAPRDV